MYNIFCPFPMNTIGDSPYYEMKRSLPFLLYNQINHKIQTKDMSYNTEDQNKRKKELLNSIPHWQTYSSLVLVSVLKIQKVSHLRNISEV